MTTEALPPTVTAAELCGAKLRLFEPLIEPVMSVMPLSALVSSVAVEIWPFPEPKVSVLAVSVPTWTVRVPLSPARVEL